MIKTNRSFQIKYVINQKELQRKKRYQEANVISSPISPNQNEQSPQKSFAHTSGPFHLIDASMDITSPNPLSPIYQQPYHRSGYISKLKIQQNTVISTLTKIRSKQ